MGRNEQTYLSFVDGRDEVGLGQGASEGSEIGPNCRAAGALGDREHRVDNVDNTTGKSHISSRHFALLQQPAGECDAAIGTLGLDYLPARHVGISRICQERLGKSRRSGDVGRLDCTGENMVRQHGGDEARVGSDGLIHRGRQEG